MKNVTVLIGDISDSKKIEPQKRAGLQKALDKAFSQISKSYAARFFSPLMLTIGDEFQAVCRSPEGAWEIVLKLNSIAHSQGIQMRFAISFGKLLTPINVEAPLKMDGPAFWKARELIERKDRRFNFHIEGDPLNSTLRILGFTLEEIENGWTSVQAGYIYYLFENPGKNPTDAARFFKKNSSTVHRMLKTTHIELYRDVKVELAFLLKGFEKRCSI